MHSLKQRIKYIKNNMLVCKYYLLVIPVPAVWLGAIIINDNVYHGGFLRFEVWSYLM